MRCGGSSWLLHLVRGVACPLPAFLFVGGQPRGGEDPVEQLLGGDGVPTAGQRRPAIFDAVEEVVDGFGEAEGFGGGGPAERFGAEVAGAVVVVGGDRH